MRTLIDLSFRLLALARTVGLMVAALTLPIAPVEAQTVFRTVRVNWGVSANQQPPPAGVTYNFGIDRATVTGTVAACTPSASLPESAWSTLTSTVPFTAREYLDSTAEVGKTYCYRANSISRAGTFTAKSASTYATPLFIPLAPPEPPTGLTTDLGSIVAQLTFGLGNEQKLALSIPIDCRTGTVALGRP